MRYVNLFILILLIGCRNEVERSLPGRYELEVDSSSSTVKNRCMSLEVMFDGAYRITTQEVEVVAGKWSAGDNGDFGWISFTKGMNVGSDGRVEGKDWEYIIIFNPSMLGIESSGTLVFVREINGD